MTLTDIATKMFKTVKLLAHPVGSIYMSTVDTSPVDLFGGTWEQITDTFLWCAGTSHAAGTTGGEETHKLTVAEMPYHGHRVRLWNKVTATGTSYAAVRQWDSEGTAYETMSAGLDPTVTWNSSSFKTTQNGLGDPGGNTYPVGSGGSHNNMPPYLSVYAWKRTA